MHTSTQSRSTSASVSSESTRSSDGMAPPGQGESESAGFARSVPKPSAAGVRPQKSVQGGVSRPSNVVGSQRISRRPGWYLGRRGPGERLKATHSLSRAMTEKRVLALLAMLMGLIAGLLILVNALDIGRSNLTLSQVLNAGIAALLGIAILVGSLLIYRGKYSSGGIINILLGIVALILKLDTIGGILAIVSGVIGLVATEAPRQ